LDGRSEDHGGDCPESSRFASAFGLGAVVAYERATQQPEPAVIPRFEVLATVWVDAG
jgi:hypothetical protein